MKIGSDPFFWTGVGTMLLIASGGAWWAWGYGLYTGMNALSAWLILTGKV